MLKNNGPSPNGKATDSDSVISRFESLWASLKPSQHVMVFLYDGKDLVAVKCKIGIAGCGAEEEDMYSFESRIRYSEVDKEGKITLNAILDYFQDSSSFHSEEIGVGIQFLKERNLAWVLSSWQIEIKRYPFYGERVKISTWPYDFKGFFGYRNFTMETLDGEVLAFANSIWTLLDLGKGRPARMLPEMIEAYQMSPQFPMKCESRKIELPKGMQLKEAFPVHKYHIDTNQHVNNGSYVGMAQEFLREDKIVWKMRAEYRKAAVYGDMIYPYTMEQEEKTIVNLADKEGNPYAIIELEGSK